MMIRKFNSVAIILSILSIVNISCNEGVADSKWPYSQEEEDRRKEEILSNCFSAWDGSHIKLTKLIKESMNDPDSYEHIETHYWNNNGKIYVETTFRGKNAFGGIVKETISATIDFNCNVIEI